MAYERLPLPPIRDDLFKQVKELKEGLTAYSTKSLEGNISDEDYTRIRKILIGIPELKDKTPEFLKQCRTLGEFWQFIKAEFAHYAERRIFLSNVFNPILDQLEEAETFSDQNYEMIEMIGEGGFGQVYKYRHKLLNMDFAFKIFAPAFSDGGEGHLERFFREARILFSLHHPNIIKVYDVGYIGRRPFLRMEFFDGKNLNKILTERGTIPFTAAVVLIENIVDALRHAHEMKIVHRDIKPSNILVAKPNQFRLIDFGLGVFIEKDLISRITRVGEHIAGGYFTAPELATNPLLLDCRSDIYSIGAVWYNLILGRPPAGMNLKENLIGAGIPENYADSLLKCLNNVETRYQNCSELLSAVNNLK